MEKIRFGKTGFMLTRTGFGCLPIQRISFDESKAMLLKAYESGLNIFDTAIGYSDSEEKIGSALSHVRKEIHIATKSGTTKKETLIEDIETSLKRLKTDYVDIYQFHNPSQVPLPEDENGLYNTMLELKKQGKIRSIGISCHKSENAVTAINSGLYDSIQYPLSSLSSDQDIDLVDLCSKKDIGILGMKAMSGGLLTNAASSFTFLRQFPNVVPIWGMQKMSELDEILALDKTPPVLDEKMWDIINEDKTRLAGSFCRACGYCMPCPQGINIPVATRIVYMAERMPLKPFLSEETKNMMKQTRSCTECGECISKCPYEINVPILLKKMFAGYEELLRSYENSTDPN